MEVEQNTSDHSNVDGSTPSFASGNVSYPTRPLPVLLIAAIVICLAIGGGIAYAILFHVEHRPTTVDRGNLVTQPSPAVVQKVLQLSEDQQRNTASASAAAIPALYPEIDWAATTSGVGYFESGTKDHVPVHVRAYYYLNTSQRIYSPWPVELITRYMAYYSAELQRHGWTETAHAGGDSNGEVQAFENNDRYIQFGVTSREAGYGFFVSHN